MRLKDLLPPPPAGEIYAAEDDGERGRDAGTLAGLMRCGVVSWCRSGGVLLSAMDAPEHGMYFLALRSADPEPAGNPEGYVRRPWSWRFVTHAEYGHEWERAETAEGVSPNCMVAPYRDLHEWLTRSGKGRTVDVRDRQWLMGRSGRYLQNDHCELFEAASSVKEDINAVICPEAWRLTGSLNAPAGFHDGVELTAHFWSRCSRLPGFGGLVALLWPDKGWSEPMAMNVAIGTLPAFLLDILRGGRDDRWGGPDLLDMSVDIRCGPHEAVAVRPWMDRVCSIRPSDKMAEWLVERCMPMKGTLPAALYVGDGSGFMIRLSSGRKALHVEAFRDGELSSARLSDVQTVQDHSAVYDTRKQHSCTPRQHFGHEKWNKEYRKFFFGKTTEEVIKKLA